MGDLLIITSRRVLLEDALGKLMEAAMGLDALRNSGDEGDDRRLEITIERINACGDTLAELIKKEISKGASS